MITFDEYIERKTRGLIFNFNEFKIIRNSLEIKHNKLIKYFNSRNKRRFVKNEEQKLISRLKEIKNNTILFDTLKVTHKRVYDMMKFILDSKNNILCNAEIAFKVAFEYQYRDRNRNDSMTKDILYFVNNAVKSIQDDSSLFSICKHFVWSYTAHPDHVIHSEDLNVLNAFLNKYKYTMNYDNFENIIFNIGARKLLPMLMLKYNFYPHLAHDAKTLVDIYNNINSMSYMLDVFCETKKEDSLRYDSFNKWDDVANLLIEHTYKRSNDWKVATTVIQNCSISLAKVLKSKYNV